MRYANPRSHSLTYRRRLLIFWSRIATQMLAVATDGVACRRVCVSVCALVTIVSPAKTAELIQMPFGRHTRVGPKNSALGGGVHIGVR